MCAQQISGPADDPLLTCFVPSNRTRALEDLYEIVIRNDRGELRENDFIDYVGRVCTVLPGAALLFPVHVCILSLAPHGKFRCMGHEYGV
jgi:hypothetical protein